jgi:hypothetical protein
VGPQAHFAKGALSQGLPDRVMPYSPVFVVGRLRNYRGLFQRRVKVVKFFRDILLGRITAGGRGILGDHLNLRRFALG